MHLHKYLVVWRRKSDTSGDLDARGFYSPEEAVQYAENMVAEKAYDDDPRYSLVQVIDVEFVGDVVWMFGRTDWPTEVETA
jgi:hypothetical protein